MSPTGFRWFLCAVVAALVAVMLTVVHGNALPARAPAIDAGTRRGDAGLVHPAPTMNAARPGHGLRGTAG